MLKYLLTLALIVLAGVDGFAKELKGVTFADEVTVASSTLKLNGLGVRRAYGMFEVYIAGLYVPETSQEPAKILEMSGPKQIVMHFKRFVDKGKLSEAWENGFRNNASKEYTYRPELNRLVSLMSNMKTDEKIVLSFFSNKAEVTVKDKPMETFESADFSKTLLQVFIGNPPDQDLKNGLLGLK